MSNFGFQFSRPGTMGTLGSSYTPNPIQAKRIATFVKHHSPIDALAKYASAVRAFYSHSQILEKWLTLTYDEPSNAFVIALDDLVNASDLTVTLVSSMDLETKTNVKNIVQPTFSYSKDTGVLSIHPANVSYKNYENAFLLTAKVLNLNLVYSLIYNTRASAST